MKNKQKVRPETMKGKNKGMMAWHGLVEPLETLERSAVCFDYCHMEEAWSFSDLREESERACATALEAHGADDSSQGE